MKDTTTVQHEYFIKFSRGGASLLYFSSPFTLQSDTFGLAHCMGSLPCAEEEQIFFFPKRSIMVEGCHEHDPVFTAGRRVLGVIFDERIHVLSGEANLTYFLIFLFVFLRMGHGSSCHKLPTNFLVASDSSVKTITAHFQSGKRCKGVQNMVTYLIDD